MEEVTEEELERDPLGRALSLMAVLNRVARHQSKCIEMLTLPDQYHLYDLESLEYRAVSVYLDGSVHVVLIAEGRQLEATWAADAYDKRAIAHTYLRTAYQFSLN